MKKLLIGLVASTALTSPAFAQILDLEKDVLTFGFIKLTDMAPLAVAYEQGYFEDEGLFVTLEAHLVSDADAPLGPDCRTQAR